MGEATAITFAKAGADIVVTSRRLPALEEVAEKVRKEGRRALAVETHIGRIDQLQPLVNKVVAEFGKLDILVNNAGTNFFSPAIDMEARDAENRFSDAQGLPPVNLRSIGADERHRELFVDFEKLDKFLGMKTRIRQEVRNLFYNMTIYEAAIEADDWTADAKAHDEYGPCCNPDCGGEWGTGCHHCHHPSLLSWWLQHWDKNKYRPHPISFHLPLQLHHYGQTYVLF